MVAGFPAVCVFVNDTLDAAVLTALAAQGTRLIVLRCAGFNNVDIRAASELGLHVVRVPAYSPHSVAEHSVALMLALNRHLHRAYDRVRNGNYALQGLLGKTVGIVGTHQGKMCCGRTPIQTLIDGKEVWHDKITTLNSYI